MVLRLRNYLSNNGPKILFMFLWISVNIFLFCKIFLHYYFGPQFYYLHKILGLGLCVSRASAACINLNCCLILLPMCRNLVTFVRDHTHPMFRQLRRLMDNGKSFHIACAYMIIVMTVVHVGGHVSNIVNFSQHYSDEFHDINVATSKGQNPFVIVLTTVPGITGILMVVCLFFIVSSAMSRFRHSAYRRFWTIHHLFILFFGLLLAHAASGVLKYQTNVNEHRPGCYKVVRHSNHSDYVHIPDPESHPEYYPNPEYHNPEPQPEFFPEPLPEFQHKPHPEVHHDLPPKPHHEPHPEVHFGLLQNVYPEDHTIFMPKMVKAEPEPEMFVAEGPGEIEFVQQVYAEPESAPDVTNKTIATSCDQPPPEFSSCSQETWMWLSFPIVLYIIERFYRRFGRTQDAPKIYDVIEHPNDVAEVLFYQKNFKAKPGQSIWVRCSEISAVESHPFTLTSIPCNGDHLFSIHVQAIGDWTQALTKLLLKAKASSIATSSDRYLTCNRRDEISLQSDSDSSKMCNQPITFQVCYPQVHINGPYGSAMEDIFRYKCSICFAGGIGITPFASVLNIILNNPEYRSKCKLQRLFLVWSCKNIDSFEWFAKLIHKVQLHLNAVNRPDFLSVCLHVTRANTDIERGDFPALSRCRVYKGRPNVTEYIQQIASRNSGQTIGVFSCGPKSLSSTVQKSCISQSKLNKCKFIFNKESF